jgi:hypothetical protein
MIYIFWHTSYVIISFVQRSPFFAFPCDLYYDTMPIAILLYLFIFVNDELGLLIYVVPIMT